MFDSLLTSSIFSEATLSLLVLMQCLINLLYSFITDGADSEYPDYFSFSI